MKVFHLTFKGGLKTKMNYIRKIRKNSKALSPVVASIILIAVTVAVSVVVAAWMGGMTIGLMSSAEQVSITNVEFTDTDTVDIMVQNSGGSDASINSAFIDGANVAVADTPIPKSSSVTVTITAASDFTSGQAYMFKLITAKGTSVVNSATYNP